MVAGRSFSGARTTCIGQCGAYGGARPEEPVRGPDTVPRRGRARAHAMPTTAKTRRAATAAPGALVLGALGVVFGDIGTSPIYTVQTVFNPGDPHPVAVSDATIFGIVSLIFWSVTLIVTVTYVLLVMRADNHGEGGIMALITLIGMLRSGSPRTKRFLVALGIFGASLFLGDSMITPAISVLSAVEGIKVAEPSLGGAVVPITATIIV